MSSTGGTLSDGPPAGSLSPVADSEQPATSTTYVLFQNAQQDKTYRIESICPASNCWRDSPTSSYTDADGTSTQISYGEFKGYYVGSMMIKMPGASFWTLIGEDVKHIIASEDGNIIGAYADTVYEDNEGEMPVKVTEIGETSAEGNVPEAVKTTHSGGGGALPPIGTTGVARFEILVRTSGVVNLVDNVKLNLLSHDRADDISITLVSPGGTRVRIADRLDADVVYNGTYTFLEAAGRNLKHNGASVETFDSRPKDSFGGFVGEFAAGTWTIEVRDWTEDNTGSLGTWEIDITTASIDLGLYEEPPPLVGIRDVIRTFVVGGTTFSSDSGDGVWSGTFPEEPGPGLIDIFVPWAGTMVTAVSVVLIMEHEQAGDVHCVLASPEGTKITVFHRPGSNGTTDGNLNPFGDPGVDTYFYRFLESGYDLLPDSAEIPAGNYRRDPGGWLGLPNDQQVQIGSFGTFGGEPIAGKWQIYMYDWNKQDDAGEDSLSGTVDEAHLSIRYMPPREFQAYVTGGSSTRSLSGEYEFYVNGESQGLISDWSGTTIFDISIKNGNNVIAVRGEKNGGGTIAAEIQIKTPEGEIHKIVTTSSWKVTTEQPTGDGWLTSNSVGDSWENASDYGRYQDGGSFPSESNARLIWASDPNADTVYARFLFVMENGGDSPVANSQTISTEMNDFLTLTLTGFDPNGFDIELHLDVPPQNGTLSGDIPDLTYTPDNDFLGLDSFTFYATSENGQSLDGTININVDAKTGGILVTGDDSNETYLNGSLLGSGSDWQQAQTYSDEDLAPGTNVVAVKATNSSDDAGLLAEIQFDGSRLPTDTANWKISTTEEEGWQDADFNDDSWDTPTDRGAYGVAPWGKPGDMTGHWIWDLDSEESTVYFRKTFTNSGAEDTGASILMTCDDAYILYLNGVEIASDSDWERSQTHDVTVLAGDNTIAIKGTNASGDGGLLAELSYNSTTVATDDTWKSDLSGDSDWEKPEYNDSSWVTADDKGAYGPTSPWGSDVYGFGGAAGFPYDSSGHWIWADQTWKTPVYFRYSFDVS